MDGHRAGTHRRWQNEIVPDGMSLKRVTGQPLPPQLDVQEGIKQSRRTSRPGPDGTSRRLGPSSRNPIQQAPRPHTPRTGRSK